MMEETAVICGLVAAKIAFGNLLSYWDRKQEIEDGHFVERPKSFFPLRPGEYFADKKYEKSLFKG